MATLNNMVAIMAALVTLTPAKELPVNMKLKAEMYETGVVHERIMATKHVSGSKYSQQPAFES